MPLPVFPLVPHYNSRTKRKRNSLKHVSENRRRTGRKKGGDYFVFELVFRKSTLEDYSTLKNFYDLMDEFNAFTYNDPIKGTSHVCYFEGDLDDEFVSFNNGDFSVTISE
jgi:hypothetical protein